MLFLILFLIGFLILGFFEEGIFLVNISLVCMDFWFFLVDNFIVILSFLVIFV